jgi:hypothetical protein
MVLGVEWGNVPDWFAAFGTAGALFVALWLLRNEMRDRRRAAEVADQKPANGVFAWVEPRTDAGGWQTFVHNRSDEPVYDAVVYFTPLTDPPMPTIESVWSTIPRGKPSPAICMETVQRTSSAFRLSRSNSPMEGGGIGVGTLMGNSWSLITGHRLPEAHF